MVEHSDHTRALIALSGDDRLHFLQGLLTQDVAQLAQASIQFAALLSPQGKILHDMFVIDGAALGLADSVLLDTPAAYRETLLKRLAMYRLRSKVTITDVSDAWRVYYHPSQGLPDPRHTALAHRLYLRAEQSAPIGVMPPEDYRRAQRTLGIPDSAADFAPDEIVALDAGYDLLHAVSFTKGCYVGQEITARMHYKQIARRGFYLLSNEGAAPQLAVLKFEEGETGSVTRDGVTYQARAPEWMAPKLSQFHAAKES